jgi:thymidylate kinase
MLITILGPDGTGKTTLAKALSEKIDGLDYVYFGYNNESRNYKYFNSFMKSEPKSFLKRIIKKGLRFINDFAIFYSAKKSHVISDRCPIDSYINTKIQGRRLRYYYALLLRIFPNPNYIILLEGDSKVIYNRKKEISEFQISSVINYYKKYLTKNNIPYLVIDTVRNDINSTFNLAIIELKEQL